MKVAHEAPLDIFDEVQKVTDYDYFLVHLFEENEEYLKKAKAAVAAGRHTLLDNSNFELGEAFDGFQFQKWINELNPSEYVIPDVFNDAYQTLQKLDDWITFYQEGIENKNTKAIGVVQGRSYDEFSWCYRKMEPRVDKIAISFGYDFLTKENGDVVSGMKARQNLVKSLLDDGIINKDKPHHLLGTYLPQEFKFYKGMDWIETIDTSNPVVTGYSGMRYTSDGLDSKPETKLFTLMDHKLTRDQKENILYNIQMFKRINEING